jgi:hypothetical protein
VTLGDHNDVNRPERARVVVREHVVSFADDSDFGSPAQYFVAVKSSAISRGYYG